MQKKNNKTRKFKKLNCSPNNKNNVVKNSCLDNKTLFKLKDLWNNNNNYTKKIKSNDPKIIWKFLRKNLKNCYNEKCWIESMFVNKNNTMKTNKKLFAPFSPITWKKNITEWLSSNDIIKVLSQYEKKYKDFKFLGPSPIDFNYGKSFNLCVWDDLCKFNLKHYIDKGYSKIGIVFNTDPHYKSGAHWVCLFINVNLKYIYFFDSTGDPPQKEIVQLVDKIKKQGIQLNINFDFIINKTDHQKGNTECGIYVLVALILLIQKKKPPKNKINKRIPDKIMIKLREKIFNI